jgi:hypothetical protein
MSTECGWRDDRPPQRRRRQGPRIRVARGPVARLEPHRSRAHPSRPRTVKAIDGLAVLRLDDGWHWIRSGLLDTTKDGRLKASIAEVELNGERCVLVRAEADLTPMSMSGSIRLTYEPVRSAL